MRSLTELFLTLLVVASPTLHGFPVVRALRPWASRGGSDNPSHLTTRAPLGTPTTTQATWSSYVTVDPTNILTVLVKHSGFLMDQKLQQLSDLMHCDEALLNVVNRELLVRNFTVSIPSSSSGPSLPALRIGRIHVTWDSYRNPCLDVEVEDVDILVEFTNLLLTRNNWNELNDLGFPPTLLYYDTATTATTYRYPSLNPPPNTNSELLRIGSLDLQGRVALHTRSRPLNKDILPDAMVFKLRTIQGLNAQIRAAAERNKLKSDHPRRGCTSDEIYELFRVFFTAKLKEALKFALEDLAASQLDPSRGDSYLTSHSKSIVSSAKAAFLSYVSDVESHSKEQVKEKILDMRGEDGDVLVPDEEVDRIVSDSLSTLKETASAMGANVLREFRGLFQTTKRSRVEDDDANDETKPEQKEEEEEEEIILFPDW